MGLGSNLDSPRAQLLKAIRHLSRALGPLRIASLYLTEPVSPVPQPWFLNTVVETTTPLGARDLLALARHLEADAGRRRGPRRGPRTLDVDLLLLGEEHVVDEDLAVPHPEISQRRFVLAPLADLRPDLRVAGVAGTVEELLGRLPATPRVDRIGWNAAVS